MVVVVRGGYYYVIIGVVYGSNAARLKAVFDPILANVVLR
jgi:hypothetical protein